MDSSTPSQKASSNGDASPDSNTLPAVPADGQDVPPLVDDALLAELPTFELFFKTFGFKRVHGRVWGVLVLASRPLSSKEISGVLSLSQGATSTTLNELSEWGAITSHFDSPRRCHLHTPVGNTLSIVATVFRRREQVVFQQFRQTADRSLKFISERYGDRDPRVLTLKSILTTCNIGEAMMQLVFSAVQNAMSDSESLLSRAINAAFRVGVGVPSKLLFKKPEGKKKSGPPAEEDVFLHPPRVPVASHDPVASHKAASDG